MYVFHLIRYPFNSDSHSTCTTRATCVHSAQNHMPFNVMSEDLDLGTRHELPFSVGGLLAD